MKNFIEELTWRGMIHDAMPGSEEHLLEGMRSAYVGFDPTADSLHIGSPTHQSYWLMSTALEMCQQHNGYQVTDM